MKTAFAKDIKLINVETAFAKDLQGKVKKKNRCINMIKHEDKLKALCQSKGWTFKGFVIPIVLDEDKPNSFRSTKILISINGIDFTPTINDAKNKNFTGNRSTNFMEHERKIKSICDAKGWTFKGFILPIPNIPSDARVLIEVADGTNKTPLMSHVESGLFTGNSKGHRNKRYKETEEEYTEKSRKFFDSIGWDFIQLHEPYSGCDTKVLLRCRCHGRYHVSSMRNCRHTNDLICPVLKGVLWAIQNGEHHISQSKDANQPMTFYIFRIGKDFIKFGISTKLDPKNRLSQLRLKTKEKITLDYYQVFTPGWQAGDLETGIKKNINGKRISKKIMSEGWSETLPISQLKTVKSFINEYIDKNPSHPIYFDDESFINISDFIDEADIDRDFAMMESMPLADMTPEDLELDLSPLETL